MTWDVYKTLAVDDWVEDKNGNRGKVVKKEDGWVWVHFRQFCEEARHHLDLHKLEVRKWALLRKWWLKRYFCLINSTQNHI